VCPIDPATLIPGIVIISISTNSLFDIKSNAISNALVPTLSIVDKSKPLNLLVETSLKSVAGSIPSEPPYKGTLNLKYSSDNIS